MKDLKVVLLLLSVFLYVEAVPYYVSCPYSDPFDRTIFFPHESDCHLFYKCDHGRVLKESCPAHLYWNPKLNTCDWPWHAGCSTSGIGNGGEGNGRTGSSGSGSEGNGGTGNAGEGSGSSGSGGSGSSPTITCPDPQPAYSVYFPDPKDCTIFYECNAGVPYQLSCPTGLHFNPIAHVCDLPELAGCSHDIVETTPGAVQTTVEEVETPPQQPSTVTPTVNPGDQNTSGGGNNGGSGSAAPISCPNPQPGYTVYLPDPNDCSIFYECNAGVPYQLNCPAGLHFNPVAHVCDIPELAGCKNGGIETTPGAVQTTAEELETSPQQPSTATPTANPGDQTTSGGSGPISCPETEPGYTVYLPDPNDCSIFYECNAGVPYQLSCPAGLHFNPVAHVCDIPELAGCKNGGIETTPGAVQTTAEEVETSPQQPSTATPTANPGDQTTSGGSGPISCPETEPGYTVYLPDPNDCSIFYECNAGVPYQLSCPAGLHFNPVAHVCDIPELAGCKNGGIETTPGAVQTTAEEVETSPQQPSTVTPTANPGDQTTSGGSGPISCPETQPGYTVYIPDPNDCSIFYECSFGVPYQLSCPVGLHFNPVSHICDTPEHAGCSHQGIIHTTSGAVQTTVEEVKTTPERPSTVTPTVNPGDQTTSGSAVTNDPSSVCPTAPEPSCPYTNPDESVFFPHPTDNHFFFHCSYGVPWCKICPAGLIWHQELLRCDF